MNNAADNIDAKSKSLKDILFERHYKVGYFQREYKWEQTHIEDLLIDLERSFNSNWLEVHTQKDVATYAKYYMGPIVLYMDGSEYSVVDGQQRLTTFLLLMIFLNGKYEDILKTKNKYEGYIFSEHYGVESYNMNIADRDKVLDHLYKGSDFSEAMLQNESCRTILERYGDIISLFPQNLLAPTIFPLFTNWLTEKLVFIEILTQTSESAYTIFETMNDRGLNLTQAELLKSFLLSNVKDETRIKELDDIWKKKISLLSGIDEDQDFFKAWLRARYAVSIRPSEKSSENKDFEKIGTRFSSWVQENAKFRDNGESKLLLDTRDPDSFFFFVKSDFNFYCDLYLKMKRAEHSDAVPEPRFKLLSYRGVSASLSYPLILAPVQKIDDEETVRQKLDIVVRYLDSFAVYRMLLSEPVTHGAIRNFMYTKVRELRDSSCTDLQEVTSTEIVAYKQRFLNEDYTSYNSDSKYILSRLFSAKHPEVEFENIYFQRRKDSYVMYQFLKIEDFESDKHGLPKGLKDRLVASLCSYCMVPRHLVNELDNIGIVKRIAKLVRGGYLLEFDKADENDLSNLRTFFIKKEKGLKDLIVNLWKV
ncbi:MAG: DUF262 domain-containing protein [Janthinobacterium lividum]